MKRKKKKKRKYAQEKEKGKTVKNFKKGKQNENKIVAQNWHIDMPSNYTRFYFLHVIECGRIQYFVNNSTRHATHVQ